MLTQRAAFLRAASQGRSPKIGRSAGMNFKQTVQISVVALGFVAPVISPHIFAGETGFENESEVFAVTKEVSRPVVSNGGLDVGISSRDGITFSAPNVLITQNGVTQILTRELVLPNGTRVLPNGSIILAGGARVQIRPEQVLSLGGQLQNAPIAVANWNTDAIIDVSRTAIVETAPGVIRSRPASRRGSARAQTGTTTQTVTSSPASTADQAPVIEPSSTPQYVDPEIEYLLGK